MSTLCCDEHVTDIVIDNVTNYRIETKETA